MGIFSKIKQGFKNLLVAGGNDGKVTGGDYIGYGVTIVNKQNFIEGKSYAGVTPLKKDAVIFGCLGKDNYIFGKEDVDDFQNIECHAKWSSGNSVKEGNRYKIKFKDGKTSIVSIVANSTGEIETIFLL